MRIFKNKYFHKWAKEVGILDNHLKDSINEINNGLYDANLGGNLFKKRISINGRGKSSGVRTILAFKKNNSAFFIYGYEKNVISNISEREEIALKELAKLYFSFSEEKLNQVIKSKELIEVK